MMYMDSAKSANKKAIIAALLALALVVGCILLPLSSEKILCAVVVVLIAGALFFRNDTGRLSVSAFFWRFSPSLLSRLSPSSR